MPSRPYSTRASSVIGFGAQHPFGRNRWSPSRSVHEVADHAAHCGREPPRARPHQEPRGSSGGRKIRYQDGHLPESGTTGGHAERSHPGTARGGYATDPDAMTSRSIPRCPARARAPPAPRPPRRARCRHACERSRASSSETKVRTSVRREPVVQERGRLENTSSRPPRTTANLARRVEPSRRGSTRRPP